jgi:hypothetical protein
MGGPRSLVLLVSALSRHEGRTHMARRSTGNMNGERYLGNTDKKEVHDLDQENTSANGCQIDEIIRAGHDKPFDSLAGAHAAGYDNCAKCLGRSAR